MSMFTEVEHARLERDWARAVAAPEQAMSPSEVAERWAAASAFPASGFPASGFPASGFPASAFPASGFPASAFPASEDESVPVDGAS